MTTSSHSGFTGKGFTLIELLVVIGIIAVLMGIVLPVLSNVRQSFRTLSCGNNIGLIAQGFIGYGMDHNGWLPAASQYEFSTNCGATRGLYYSRPLDSNEVNVRSSGGKGNWYGQGLLMVGGYVDDPETFICPEEDFAFSSGNARAKVPESIAQATQVEKAYSSSYAYRGGLLSKKKTAEGPLNLSRNGGHLAILADWAEFTENDTPHGYAHNVAYLDTHVKFYQFETPIVKNSDMTALWKELNAFWD